MQRLFIVSFLLFLISCKSKKEDAPQADNWVLTNRKIFTDKLNAFGLPDTTYTKVLNYENLNIKDSSEVFAVSKYDENRRLTLKTFFLAKKDGPPSLNSQSRYIYSGKYLASVIDEMNGVVTKQEKYNYDTSGKILSSSIVRLKNFDKILERYGDKVVEKEALTNQGYDTLHISYKYDGSNKNIGGDMVDNRGNLIRRDVNVYSGNSPMASYNLGPKGDTIQHIMYVQQGNQLTSQADNNEFTIVTVMNSGYTTGKLTLDKKKNEKVKQEWIYENGRVVEEKFYTTGKGSTVK